MLMNSTVCFGHERLSDLDYLFFCRAGSRFGDVLGCWDEGKNKGYLAGF